MVPVMSLWLPILVAAVLVFLGSSVIHMVLQYHNSNFGKVPNEEGVLDALRPFAIPPGEYVIPHAESYKEMGTPEFTAKLEQGPVAFMTVLPNGKQGMGGQLALWFVYSILVGIMAAYIAGPGTGDRAPSTCRSSDLRAPPRSSPTAWGSGRTPSGTSVPGARL